MKIKVPRRKRGQAPVAPAGKWRGRVTAVEEPTDTAPATLTWGFSANGQEWDVPQVPPDRDSLINTLVDLGHGGKEVDLADIVGSEAMIIVRTFGGQRSAKVVETEKLPAGS